uniref:Conotoxin Cl6.13 n=1 Tax=Californiconus californicus TaxID=1736779 RepID=U6DD_CONCL
MKFPLLFISLALAAFLTRVQDADSSVISKEKSVRDGEEFPCAGTMADCRGLADNSVCCDTGKCIGEVCYY